MMSGRWDFKTLAVMDEAKASFVDRVVGVLAGFGYSLSSPVGDFVLFSLDGEDLTSRERSVALELLASEGGLTVVWSDDDDLGLTVNFDCPPELPQSTCATNDLAVATLSVSRSQIAAVGFSRYREFLASFIEEFETVYAAILDEAALDLFVAECEMHPEVPFLFYWNGFDMAKMSSVRAVLSRGGAQFERLFDTGRHRGLETFELAGWQDMSEVDRIRSLAKARRALQ